MTDINVGAITEALNDKSDRDLRNVDNTAGADAVIDFQVPTAENGYTWYRKYKSGWVEQGGKITLSGGSMANTVVSLPQQMSDTNYVISCTSGFAGNGDYSVTIAINTNSTTTTSFAFVKHWTSASGICYWEAKGMAAS